MSELISIDGDLRKENILIHLYYMILDDFDNNPKYYDYSESVIEPVTQKIKSNFTLKNIKFDDVVENFREFYWHKLSIDPTKIRPSGEALTRRILQNKKLPKINYFVDGYNWASAATRIPIGAYDLSKFSGAISLRHAKSGEKFLAIGGKRIELTGNELITIADDGTILSQFPYRDANETKITKKTRRILVTLLGIDGIAKLELFNAANLVVEYLRKCKLPQASTFKASEPVYVSNF